MKPLYRRLVACLAAAGALGVGLVAHADLEVKRGSFPEEEDLLYLPPPQQLKYMSLGYKEALADLIWIRAVIFTGERAGGQNYAWILKYLEAIFELAPQFRRPYAWGGVTLMYTGEAVDKDMLDRATELYRQGLERHPDDHEMLFALGMILARDVQSTEGYSEQDRLGAKAEGADLLRRAAAAGAPPLVRQLAATMVDDFATDALAIQFLETQLLSAEDEDYRRMLETKLDALVGREAGAGLRELKSAFDAERMLRKPYMPDTDYAVMRAEDELAPR